MFSQRQSLLFSDILKKSFTFRKVNTYFFDKDQIIQSLKNKLGIYNYPRHKMKTSASYLYISATDAIPYKQFFEYFGLKDTYFSWFSLTTLHLWIIMFRVMSEGKEGHFLRNELMNQFWEDAEERLKLIGIVFNRERKKILNSLIFYNYGAMFGYDEGLLTNDQILSAAFWRNLYAYKQDDPRILERAVIYTRNQIDHIIFIEKDFFFIDGRLKWKQIPPFTQTSDEKSIK